jgi:hypothetical protein
MAKPLSVTIPYLNPRDRAVSTVHLSATAGPDGVLRLSIPVGSAGEFEVTVVATPKAAEPEKRPTPEELGWPPEFLQNVMGSIDDETFGVHLLRDLPPTEPLE